MPARRRLLAATSTALALAALTGCEKPAPLVTLVSGGQSVYKQANLYCFDEGVTVDSGECAQRAEGATRLEVQRGETVGVDVGKDLVERGWRVQLGSGETAEQVQASDVLEDQHYFTFTAPDVPEEGIPLTVLTVDEADVSTGEWLFLLVPKG
jgi:hypothetical protein